MGSFRCYSSTTRHPYPSCSSRFNHLSLVRTSYATYGSHLRSLGGLGVRGLGLCDYLGPRLFYLEMAMVSFQNQEPFLSYYYEKLEMLALNFLLVQYNTTLLYLSFFFLLFSTRSLIHIGPLADWPISCRRLSTHENLLSTRRFMLVCPSALFSRRYHTTDKVHTEGWRCKEGQ